MAALYTKPIYIESVTWTILVSRGIYNSFEVEPQLRIPGEGFVEELNP